MSSNSAVAISRRFAVGAEVHGDFTSFRVWAPLRRRVALLLNPATQPQRIELERDDHGYWSASVGGVKAGARYGFLLDDGERALPDPASRFQPEGPHGLSEVIDPSPYRWRDQGWRGAGNEGQVIYELHVGTYTEPGSYRAIIPDLARLRDLGVTTIEILPVADFPGRFGWGYDGVNLWAPTRLYGRPDDLRALIDAAHANGLAVILDVVYNHFGPDGNYLKEFSPFYFTSKYENEWGDAINFDGEGADGSRQFFIENARYWIEEFHFDGLRLDATQQIFDSSEDHILAALQRVVRAAARDRSTFVVVENEPQDARLITPAEHGGFGLDAAWNDDFHHAAIVAMTGRHDAYYSDYLGKPQEFISAAKWGFLYQGQWYSWQKARRGTPSIGIPSRQFVCFLENHDQVANSGDGRRLAAITDPGTMRAMTALLLLGPWTPMLFQGQEFGSTRPFLYFADHEPALAEAVERGRREFLHQFRSLATVEMQGNLAMPHDPETFEQCKLDHTEIERHRGTVALHRDLLTLRRQDPAFRAQDSSLVHGAVLSESAFLLRFVLGGVADRLLIINLGRDLHFNPAPEPLLAPPSGCRWEQLWSSESPEYGGSGTPEADTDDNWLIRGRAALVLQPAPENTNRESRT